MSDRKIIHVDMDAFYASVEQRDFPARYAGTPIAVGGRPPRGVVMAASYEARPYGVHSAQPSAEAARLCPDLVFVQARFDVYREASRRVRRIFARYTDLIEPLSMDEAYLDVTTPKQGPPSGTLIARAIRAAIRDEMGLTASAGVAPNKFVAKVASDRDKPDGLTVVPPDAVVDFIAALPVDAFHGVGPVTAQALRSMDIHTGADLQDTPEDVLVQRFGKRGRWFHRIAHGNDTRPVRPNRTRKSVGAENTFVHNVTTAAAMLAKLHPLAERVAQRLQRAGRQGRTVTLKIKNHRHAVTTRQTTLDRPVGAASDLMTLADRLLHDPHVPRDPIRLLGLSVSSLTTPGDDAPKQLWLPFPEGPPMC